MPRQARIDVSGLLYHIMIRGIEKRVIFPTREDREDFIERLKKSIEESGAKCFAWVLMPNHVHLLIKTGEKKLSSMMRSLLTGYATNFNLKYERSGHLFQNRYKSIICEEEKYLLDLIRYIHLNPLRAGIVREIAELDDYEWSGHSAIVGKCKRQWQETEDFLKIFGKDVESARENYRDFIKRRIKSGGDNKYHVGGLKRSRGMMQEEETAGNGEKGMKQPSDARILGSGEFVIGILKDFDKNEILKCKIKSKLDLGQLIYKVSKYYGMEVSKLKGDSRMRGVSKARAVLVNIGIDYMGLSGREFEKELNISSSGISKLHKRGEAIIGGEKRIVQEIIS